MRKLKIGKDLNRTDKIYRYMSFESFIAMMESQSLNFAHVNNWEDPWEAIAGKLPTVNGQNEVVPRFWNIHQEMYGQCWTHEEDSDALWRIYSIQHTDIQISTTIEKLELIQGTRSVWVDNVIYFDGAQDLLNKLREHPHSLTEAALFKRGAFKHEREVRVITIGQAIENYTDNARYVSLPISIPSFIESITLAVNDN